MGSGPSFYLHNPCYLHGSCLMASRYPRRGMKKNGSESGMKSGMKKPRHRLHGGPGP